MSIPSLVFDFDGVLADTEPLHWQEWARLLAAYDCDFTWAQYEVCGRGIADRKMRESLIELFPHLPPSLPDEELRARKQRVIGRMTADAPIGADIASLLRELKDSGRYPIGLVTTSSQRYVIPALEHAGIRDCFDACVFGGDVQRHKPDPEAYLLIAGRLRAEPGVAFEDSDAGIQSATAAGFEAIRVPSPAALHHLVRNRLARD